MKKSIIFLLSFLFLSIAYGQDEVFENLDFTRKLSKETSQYIAAEDFATATEYIQPFWPIPKSEFERFKSQATKSFKIISEGLGKPLSSVKIKEQNLGDLIFREIYFIQYPESPIRVEYIYYKTDKGWVINNIQWSGDYELEYD